METVNEERVTFHASAGVTGAADPARVHGARWRTAAALVAILPAAAAAWVAQSIIELMRTMARLGLGGVGPVSSGLYEANQLLAPAALAAAAIAGVLAFAVVRSPARAAAFPALWFALLAPVLACAPALPIWAAESLAIDVIANRFTEGLAEGSGRLANLLMGSLALAVVVIGFTVAAAALRRMGTGRDARACAFAWASAALLLLVLAAAFYARTSYLHEAALRGHL
jgi:hypothetical protein